MPAPHCRAELKRRTGIDLPPIEDSSFWGNWENPAFRQWLDLRVDAGKEFFEKLMPQLPKDFPVTTCGQNSATNTALHLACDAQRYVEGGNNYVHMEMSGNTPPYQGDPVTVNVPVSSRMVGFSHHQAVARENGIRSFSTGYGFTEPSANIIWALNKLMDVDCCFSTLKARLGLPEHILKTLPEEPEVVGTAYTFEKEHPQLFAGELLAQVGVFFSYETRNNTLYGSLRHGYYADYARTLQLLSGAGVSFHTLLRLPEDTREYPVIILSGVAKMTDKEQKQLAAYLEKGGKVLVCGPTAVEQCESPWQLPNRLALDDPEDYFSTIRDGVWIQQAQWMTQTKIETPDAPKEWQEVAPGLYYNPHRVGDSEVGEALLELSRRFVREQPVGIEECRGYLTSMFRTEDSYVLHFLAQDYDVDIDHKLDEMRFHRSRVNYVNQVTPVNVSRIIRLRCEAMPEVFTPFDPAPVSIAPTEGGYQLTLPQDAAYIIVRIPQ